jgi:hypothetical protein
MVQNATNVKSDYRGGSVDFARGFSYDPGHAAIGVPWEGPEKFSCLPDEIVKQVEDRS